nr:hypothetical protein [uncultured Holophaga sp.]
MKAHDQSSPIDREFKLLEHVFTTYKNAKAAESNRHAVDDPNRVEADLAEIEKAHLNLLQSKLNATIAKEILGGMARSSSENARFSRMLFALNIVIAAATVFYTWITWQSVRAMRQGNEIQIQALQNQSHNQKNNLK